MKMKFMVTVGVALFFLAGLTGWGQPAPGTLPWENPNSGFDKPVTGGSSGGTDKIETVIKTSGSTTDSGKTVSSTGSDKQQSFVNGFLNSAADKIKGSNGGSGWVWTWQKKWKIGPDGKPVEVKEEYQQGNIGTTAKPGQATGPGGGATAPSTPATPAAPVTTANPGATVANPTLPTGPTGPASPGNTPAGVAVAPPKIPATTSTPGTPAGTSGKKAPTTSPATKGVEAAPQALPRPVVQLVIQNPVNQQEEPYSNNVYPKENLPVTTKVGKNKPVPEDTRVKICLDFDESKIRREDLTLTVTDNEGETKVSNDEMKNYRHIFRIPDLQKYYARVNYHHPLTGEDQEVIHVTIPVYPLDFKNRTIDFQQNRSDGDDQSAVTGKGAGSSSSSGGGNGSYSGSSGSSNGSSGTRGSSSSAGGDGSFVGGNYSSESNSGGESGGSDLTDLYSNPSAAGGSNENAGSSAEGAVGGNGGSGGSNEGAGNDSTQMASAVGGGSGNPDANGSNDQNDCVVDGSSGGNSGNSGSDGAAGGGSSNNPATSGSSDGSGGSDSASSGAGDASNVAAENGYSESGNSQAAMGGNSRSGGRSGYGDSADPKLVAANSGSPNTTPNTTPNLAESSTADRNYILSLSVKNEATKAAQSFDFASDPFPTASSIKQNTHMTFSIDLSKNVNRDSVNVVIFDGKEKSAVSLGTAKSDVFDHTFAQPTAEAYIWIYGSTLSAPFSYKLSIPVND